MMVGRDRLTRFLLAVLLVVSLLGGQQIASVHAYSHVAEARAAWGYGVVGQDQDFPAHACVTCLALGGLCHEHPTAGCWIAASDATTVLQSIAVKSAPILFALAAYRSRAPPLS